MVLLWTIGCGHPAAMASRPEGDDSSWRRSTLLAGGAVQDARVIGHPAGWVVVASLHYDLAVWGSADGLEWDRVDDPFAGLPAGSFFQPSGVAYGDRGLTVVGSYLLPPEGSEPDFGPVPMVLHAADGEAWTLIQADDSGGLMYGVVAHPGGFVAVGDTRAGDPHGCPCRPRAWYSHDGITWANANPIGDAFAGDGGMASVSFDGSRFVAVGNVDQHAAVWASEGGSAWTRTNVGDAFGQFSHVNAVEAAPDGHLAVGGVWDATAAGGQPAAWASPDGALWKRVPLDAAVFGNGDSRLNSVTRRGQRWLLTGQAHIRADPRFCYVDLDSCDSFQSAAWVSTDGLDWNLLDLRQPPFPDDLSLMGAATSDTATVLVGQSDGEGLDVWTWPSESQPPTREPIDYTIPEDVPPLARPGERLGIGTVYAYPTSRHCGLFTFGPFNGSTWIVEERLRDLADYPTNNEVLYGTIRLLSALRAEYSVSGDPIAVLRPGTPDPDRFCD